jgi:hypothetical protein
MHHKWILCFVIFIKLTSNIATIPLKGILVLAYFWVRLLDPFPIQKSAIFSQFQVLFSQSRILKKKYPRALIKRNFFQRFKNFARFKYRKHEFTRNYSLFYNAIVTPPSITRIKRENFRLQWNRLMRKKLIFQ